MVLSFIGSFALGLLLEGVMDQGYAVGLALITEVSGDFAWGSFVSENGTVILSKVFFGPSGQKVLSRGAIRAAFDWEKRKLCPGDQVVARVLVNPPPGKPYPQAVHWTYIDPNPRRNESRRKKRRAS